MAIPFASAYQPINLLNDAIQNQAARQQAGYLQASALNDASVADSLNRIVQQKALEQQSRDRQAHYGLQQQQLANDLAYRQRALGQSDLARAEQARQFDATLKLNAEQQALLKQEFDARQKQAADQFKAELEHKGRIVGLSEAELKAKVSQFEESQKRQADQFTMTMKAEADRLAAQGRQFDRTATLNETIARANIDNPKMDPSMIPAIVGRDESNALAGGTASAVNIALNGAKQSRDDALAEIRRVRGSWSPGDIFRDLYTSNGDWARKVLEIEAEYRKQVGSITQAAQGHVTIRNKIHPQTQQSIPDEYEALPISLPQIPFLRTPRGVGQTPAAAMPTGLPPSPFTGNNWNMNLGGSQPQANPFANFGAVQTNAPAMAVPTNAPTFIPPATNNLLRLDLNTDRFIPVQ